jgi:hypothetical protein
MWVEINDTLLNLNRFHSILKWDKLEAPYPYMLILCSTVPDDTEELKFKTREARDEGYDAIRLKVLHGE